jgi:hypothetical protein
VYVGVDVDGHVQLKEATVDALPSWPCAFSGVMPQ